MISPETLQQIADAAPDAPDEAALERLKQRWPELRFTFCNADDMPARLPPALRRTGLNLYLINGSEHCLSLTNDPAQAIGVVLAWGDDED